MVRAQLGNPPIAAREGNGKHRTDTDWEIYPEGLYHVSEWAWKRYKLPIIISENGLADKADRERPRFLKTHIVEVRKLRMAGVPVFGYLYWSLTDNYEWTEGFAPRLGLIEIDYKTLKRTPRPSYYYFQKLIRDLPM